RSLDRAGAPDDEVANGKSVTPVIAVSGMHYTAMTGVTLFPFATSSSGAPALSSDLLAIVVAVVAFCISGIFLLLLLPDSARAASSVVPRGDPIAVTATEVPAAPST